MGQTILGKISASAEAEGADDPPDDEAPPQESPEEGLTDEPVKNTAPTVSVPDTPVIGLDGRTADGSMPYEILKRQLAFMR
jgi:hypothetical protein